MKVPLPKLKRQYVVIGILLAILILLRIPSLFEPHSSNDEGAYSAISHFIHNGAILYKDIWDDHPPGVYAIYYLAGYFSTLNLFVIKLLNLIFACLTTIFIYKLAKRFFNQSIGFISAVFAVAILGFPLLGSNISHSENFFMLFSVIGVYTMLAERNKGYFFSGFWFSIATLFDLRIFFVVCSVCIGMILIQIHKNKVKKIPVSLFIFSAGLLIPWVITLLFLAHQQSLSDFTNTVLASFVQGFHKESVDSLGFILFQSSPTSRTVIALGLVLFSSYIFLKKQISRNQFFIFLWAVAIFYSVLFSQDSYTYIILQAVPIISIISGYVIHRIQTTENIKSTVKFISLYVLSIFFFLNLFSAGRDLCNSRATVTYYKNFIAYLTGSKDTTSYIQSFGVSVDDQYTLNTYLQQNVLDDKNIYIWTENPWIVKISELDLVVPYIRSSQANEHIVEVLQILRQKRPSYIVIDQRVYVSPLLEEFLTTNSYSLIREIPPYLIYQLNDAAVTQK